jgi:dihydroorotase-like cyclic amidohydrolase
MLHENKHITQRYTLAEIRAQMDEGEYSAELLLHHLCLHANDMQRENTKLRAALDNPHAEREALAEKINAFLANAQVEARRK